MLLGHPLQVFGYLVGGERAAHQIALDCIASHLPQPFHLFHRFHAFGHRLKAQLMGQPDGSGDDGLRIRLGPEGLDEGAIDLEGVDGEMAKVAKG